MDSGRTAQAEPSDRLFRAASVQFEQILSLACQVCGTEAGGISIAQDGLDSGHFFARRGTTLEELPPACAAADPSFEDGVFEIHDAGEIPEAGGFRFFAGAPLLGPAGEAAGALTVFGPEPRTLSAEQRRGLFSLSRLASEFLDLQAAELARAEKEKRRAFEKSHDLFQSITAGGRILFVNRAWAEAVGSTPEDARSKSLLDFLAPESRDHFQSDLARLTAGEPAGELNLRFLAPDGHRIEVQGRAEVRAGGAVIDLILRDVTELRLTQQIARARAIVLERLARAGSLAEIFDALLKHIERVYPEHPASILLLKGAKLHYAASVGLPQFYNDAIEGLEIGPNVGSCGAAAYTGRIYVAKDISTDPNWIPFVPLAQKAGLSACWSQPVFGDSDHVIGTIAVYSTRPQSPRPVDLRVLEECTRLASLAIQRRQADQERADMVQNLETIVRERTVDLRESERFVRATLDALSAQIAVLDENGIILATNFAWDDFARKNGAVGTIGIGTDYLGVCRSGRAEGAEEAERACELLVSVLDGKAERESFEYPCHSDTEQRWFLCTFTRFPGEGPVRVAVSHEDITARKLAELEALQSKKQFQDYFEYAPDAVVVSDNQGRIVLVNREAELLLGYARSELVGLSTEVLLPEERRQEHTDARSTFPARPGSALLDDRHRDSRVRRKDGTIFPADIKLSPLNFADGPGAAASVRDISKRIEAEKRALRTQRLESIGTLAGGIAHDLNNALAPIVLSADLLRAAHPEDARMIGTIEASAKRGANMVRQLLTFARGVEGERALVDPGTVMGEVEGIIENSFPKNIRLETHVAAGLWAVRGDRTQLSQVLLNLCVNARDAMPDGGELVLATENIEIDQTYASRVPGAHPGRFVVWTVSDSGCGISPEVLDRIFEPFFTTKAPERGTGLGLSTSMGIVKSHGGFLQVYSAVGHGSRFLVYLPADSEAAREDSERRSSAAFSGHGETILIVDDEEAIRAVSAAVLEALGLKSLLARSGAEGLELAKAQGVLIRAVVTDMHMPDMDGLAFVKALRSIPVNAPVVVASGHLSDAELHAFAGLGVSAFLDKPFTLARFAEALRPILFARPS